jgi:hypothetical protein
MYRAGSSPTRVNLVAQDSLQLAGLRRAATEVGMEITEDDAESQLCLRSCGVGVAHPTLDVEIHPDRVVVTVTQTPEARVWMDIDAILEQLGSAREGFRPADR